MGTKNKVRSSFPDILADLIKNSGKKLREISRECGIGASQLSSYQSGASEPTLSNLVILSDYFDVPIDYLVGKTKSSTRDPDIWTACDITGLSSTSVSRLHEVSEYIKANPIGIVQNPYDVLLSFDGPEYTLQPDGKKVSASKVFWVSLSDYLHERATETVPGAIAELGDDENAELFSLSEQLAAIGYTVVPKQVVTNSMLQDACDALRALFREYGDNMRGCAENGKHRKDS